MGNNVSAEHHNNEVRRLEHERWLAQENARRLEEERQEAHRKFQEREEEIRRQHEEEQRKHELYLQEQKAREEERRIELERERAKAERERVEAQREHERRLEEHKAREEERRIELERERAKAEREREEARREHERIMQETKAREELLAAERAAEQALREKELDLLRENLEKTEREAEAAKEALEKGRRPVVEPTQEEWQAAKERINYNPAKLHFAVCGTSGSGKSSLINALRGLKDTDQDAAAVGICETTKEISTYSDSRDVFSRFVWCDIPGAGTLTVPDWKYFNDQGLFVFDFIVLPYDIRLTSIDVGIIKNCYRFNIPVFVVRSKSDQHISNMVIQKYNIDSEDDEWSSRLKAMRPVYCNATREDFQNNMKQAAQRAPEEQKMTEPEAKWLQQLKVYLVTAAQLRAVVNMKTGTEISKKLRAKLVDEESLVNDMLNCASLRRLEDVVKEEGEVTAASPLLESVPTKLEETVLSIQELSVQADSEGAWHYIGADGERAQC